ncbi:hypothetical protein C8R45DRAFT_1219948 [Mycena sanguinolenta]|nr:hypothetical protein C8R45DRAFT_1219948 [Mycena sanguinolenta]
MSTTAENTGQKAPGRSYGWLNGDDRGGFGRAVYCIVQITAASRLPGAAGVRAAPGQRCAHPTCGGEIDARASAGRQFCTMRRRRATNPHPTSRTRLWRRDDVSLYCVLPSLDYIRSGAMRRWECYSPSPANPNGSGRLGLNLFDCVVQAGLVSVLAVVASVALARAVPARPRAAAESGDDDDEPEYKAARAGGYDQLDTGLLGREGAAGVFGGEHRGGGRWCGGTGVRVFAKRCIESSLAVYLSCDAALNARDHTLHIYLPSSVAITITLVTHGMHFESGSGFGI